MAAQPWVEATSAGQFRVSCNRSIVRISKPFAYRPGLEEDGEETARHKVACLSSSAQVVFFSLSVARPRARLHFVTPTKEERRLDLNSFIFVCTLYILNCRCFRYPTFSFNWF